jgi:hypothetical protein
MGILLMALTIGGLIVAAILLVASLIAHKTWLTKFTLGGVAVWTVFYAAMLLGFSLSSKETTIAVGDTDGKAFCGFYLDCHMNAAVTSVRATKTLVDKVANGEFYIVKVKIFSNAVSATLSLTDLSANVHDATGEHYHRDREAEEQLTSQPAFEKPIGPHESFEKEIVFDLPVDVREPRLDLREGFGLDHMLETVLIGDEDSMFHKRQLFKLTEQSETAGVK